MKTRFHFLVYLFLLGIASAVWAKDGPTPAPKISSQVGSKGVGDPYPAADALARKNTSVFMEATLGAHKNWEEADLSKTQAKDASGTSLDVATGSGPSFAWAEKHFNESLRNCSALDSGITPQGMAWSRDLQDYVVSPQAMQAALALKGQLFAPMGTSSWRILRISYYLHFKRNKSQLQGFMRVLHYVSTASPTQIRQTVLQLSADRGYRATDVELRKSSGYMGGDSVTFLAQQVTPNVENSAMVAADKLGEDDEKADPKIPVAAWSPNCLVTDDFGKDWLKKINPKTGEKWSPADLTFGYIVQTSYIPLGEQTEPYTNAHVDERLARERNVTPEQIAALRKTAEDQVQREIWRNAPQSRKALADLAVLQDQVLDMVRHSVQEIRQFFSILWD